MNDKQRKRYFAVHATNDRHGFEKLVEAPSPQYIKSHQSEFFGKGIKINKIDANIYKKAKTEEEATGIMQKRFRYKVVDGTRMHY